MKNAMKSMLAGISALWLTACGPAQRPYQETTPTENLPYRARLALGQGYDLTHRPAHPEITRNGNFTEVRTNGYDLAIESIISNRPAIIELGEYWCTPCQWMQYRFREEGNRFPSWDFVSINLAFPDSNGDPIHSPATRYVTEHGDSSVPFFLVYDHGRQVGHFDLDSYPSSPNTLDRLVEYASNFVSPSR